MSISQATRTYLDHAATSPVRPEVAEQVAAGCTNAQATAALFLSKRTVDTHLRNIYRRLGISNRSELTEFFKNNYREQE